MGVGRICSRGGTGRFFQNISSGGAKSGEICFFPLEYKKTTFFGEIFKIQEGAKSPLCPPPSNAHAYANIKSLTQYKSDFTHLHTPHMPEDIVTEHHPFHQRKYNLQVVQKLTNVENALQI